MVCDEDIIGYGIGSKKARMSRRREASVGRLASAISKTVCVVLVFLQADRAPRPFKGIGESLIVFKN